MNTLLIILTANPILTGIAVFVIVAPPLAALLEKLTGE